MERTDSQIGARLRLRPIASLVPYAANARLHSEEQVAQLVRSILEWGWTNPVLEDGENIVAGHGRVLAAERIYADGGEIRFPDGSPIPAGTVPTLDCSGWTAEQRRAYVLADNKLALNASWDDALLKVELDELVADGFDIDLIGFEQDEIDVLDGPEIQSGGNTDPDAVPEIAAQAVSQPGDVWLLGRHRVMCGDSTVLDDVQKLVGGELRAALLHADPPYGMGKEGDGVANDNLYREKLDAFQMDWWAVWRTFMADNAGVYIWGNAPDLWRLWYRGGLAGSEQLELRNEIVWDKKSIPGMASAELTQYPEASERCLYFQVGAQFIGNVNADDFPETWEPLRSYLKGEADAAGIKPGDIAQVCGCGMYGHWFSRSQFTLVPEKHYATLAATYTGHFARPWADLKAEWARVRGSARDGIARSYFDNAHDSMRDVWEFSRVTGDERHGHATPKPVAMMERVMKSSLPSDGVCLEPFGGSGSTLMGAELTHRACYTMELQGVYVDAIVKRWQGFTGKAAKLEADGRTFAQVSAKAPPELLAA